MVVVMNVLNKQTKIIQSILFLCMLLGGLVVFSSRVEAATLHVGVAGCTYYDAAQSINDSADTGTCVSTGDPYETNDTINIPAGTTIMTASPPALTKSATVQGVGMGQSIMSGDNGQHSLIQASSQISITIRDLTLTQFFGAGISVFVSDLDINRVEIDCMGATSGMGTTAGLMAADSGEDSTVDIDNLYVHDLVLDSPSLNPILIGHETIGSTTTANLSNITVDNAENTNPSYGANGLLIAVGSFFNGGGGTMNATITNATVNNIRSDSGVGAFAAISFAFDAPSTVNMAVKSSTVTGVEGGIGSLGNSSASFGAGAASEDDQLATANVTVENSLFADNTNNGVPRNCAAEDYSSYVGGTGPTSLSIESLGYNISDDASCTGFTEEGDQQNVTNIISTLGPIQNNGGLVPTRALLPGSPAIGNGKFVLGITTDARGVARPMNNPDVGAFQSTLVPTDDEEPADELAETGRSALLIVVAGLLIVLAAGVVARKAFLHKA